MVAFEHPHPHGALLPTGHLALPFFDDRHRALANALVQRATTPGGGASDEGPHRDGFTAMPPDRRSELVQQELLAHLAAASGEACPLPPGHRVLEPGSAVAAATALGLARCALAVVTAQLGRHRVPVLTASEGQQAGLGMVHQRIETAALLTYRTAWAQDLPPRPETGHPGLETAQQTADLQAAIGHALAAAGLAADLLGDRAPSATAMVCALEQRIGQLQADPVQHQRALHTLGGLVLKA